MPNLVILDVEVVIGHARMENVRILGADDTSVFPRGEAVDLCVINRHHVFSRKSSNGLTSENRFRKA